MTTPWSHERDLEGIWGVFCWFDLRVKTVSYLMISRSFFRSAASLDTCKENIYFTVLLIYLRFAFTHLCVRKRYVRRQRASPAVSLKATGRDMKLNYSSEQLTQSLHSLPPWPVLTAPNAWPAFNNTNNSRRMGQCGWASLNLPSH